MSNEETEIFIPLRLLGVPDANLHNLSTQVQIQWKPNNVNVLIVPKDGIEDADEMIKFLNGKGLSPKEPLWRIIKYITNFYSIDGEDISLFSKYYELKGELGKGGFGRVFKCQHKLDGEEFAIKIIPFADEDEKDTLRELRALPFQHQNVVKHHKAWVEDFIPNFTASDSDSDDPDANKCLYILMEVLESSLGDMKQRDISGDVILRIFQDSVNGLVYLHSKNLIHCDISSANLFVDAQGTTKIGDFGLVVDDDGMTHPIGGKPIYHPPEFKNLPYSDAGYKVGVLTKSVDIYALGVVIVDLIFKPKTVMQLDKIVHDMTNNEIVPEQNKKMHVNVIEILLEMLALDASKRPSAKHILLRIT